MGVTNKYGGGGIELTSMRAAWEVEQGVRDDITDLLGSHNLLATIRRPRMMKYEGKRVGTPQK